ncbi:MAG: hypothetical protein LBK25_04490, partial [Treponema sp.]|jgi:hypothetical protein|nr:hypothetical protein [Treponema sp.]
LAPDIIELAPDIIKLPKYIIKLGTYTDSPVCTRCALIGGVGGFSASGLKAFPQVLGYDFGVRNVPAGGLFCGVSHTYSAVSDIGRTRRGVRHRPPTARPLRWCQTRRRGGRGGGVRHRTRRRKTDTAGTERGRRRNGWGVAEVSRSAGNRRQGGAPQGRAHATSV